MSENVTLNTQVPESSATRPGWLELIVALVGGVVIYLAGITLLVLYPAPTLAQEGVAQLAFSGFAPLAVFGLVVLVRLRKLSPFGVRRVEPKWLLVAVAIAAVCLAIILTFDALMATYFPGIDDSQGQLRASASGGIATLIGTIFFGGILTPLGEELLFRGILTRFFQRWGNTVAIIVGSVIFAAWHGINLVFPSALLVGLCCAWLLCRTKSIWPGVVVHIIYNTSFLLIYSFS